MIGKVKQQQPKVFLVLQKWQSSVAESSCNTARTRSSLTSKEKSVVKF